MRKYLLTTLVFISFIPAFSQTLKVVNPRCEYKVDPIIEIATPHLSWELQSESRGTVQIAYRVLIADNVASLEKNIGNVWDSKKVISSASMQVKYAGARLLAAKKYYWKAATACQMSMAPYNALNDQAKKELESNRKYIKSMKLIPLQ